MIKFQIKLCPFCGGKPQVSSCVDYSVIFCSCGISSRENRTGTITVERIKTIVDEWNTRVPDTNQYVEHIHRDWGER